MQVWSTANDPGTFSGLKSLSLTAFVRIARRGVALDGRVAKPFDAVKHSWVDILSE